MQRNSGSEFANRVRYPLVFLALLAATTAFAADVSGSARVVDGDTIVVGNTRVRLEGIDAPETDQICLDAKGERWTCGVAVRDQLAEHIGNRDVVCADKGHDKYGRMLALCSAAGENLNEWMVTEGFALAYTRFSQQYVAQERTAREAKRGMWRGAFIAPWEWRHRDRETVILGAYSVPITAQSMLLAPASSEGAPSPECTIKGNVNRKGEHIYHMPGQHSYGVINMVGSGKRWFCSEDEAQAAGWRRAR